MRRVPLEGPTLAVADAHLNDVDCLYRSFSSALDVALAQLAELRPPQVNLLIAGDWVAGRGIFRGQEFRLLLGDVNWQALVGAEVLWEVVERIRDACGAQVKTYYVKGNHDVDKSSGFEFGLWVVKLAQQWGLDCEYFPLDVVVELAPGVNALVLHGFGYSMYRPQSPAFINAIMRRVMDLNLGRSPEEQISRVIHGHAHWLDVDFHLSGWGIAIDSLGGWQRNTRLSLGRTSRPTGFILYVPEGEKLYLVPIEPDPQILDQETHNPRLVARNILTVGQWLDRALERLGYEL
jgi:UDP-2,3-diacylglucosamine pyrophosphatase LpxH